MDPLQAPAGETDQWPPYAFGSRMEQAWFLIALSIFFIKETMVVHKG